MKKIILLVGGLIFVGLGIIYLKGNDLFEMWAAPTIIFLGIIAVIFGIKEFSKK